MVSYYSVSLHSLVTNDVVCLFIFLLAIYFEVSVESFAHEKKLDYLFYYY